MNLLGKYMKHSETIEKKNINVRNWNQLLPAFLILFTLIQCIIWIQVTDFIEDDAFITFRFAEQLANG